MQPDNCFLTLTYDDDHLIFGGAKHAILNPRDLTLFFKRLRKRYGPGIRHFSCGEYGDKSSRPHYHAIVFGLDFEDKQEFSAKDGYRLYRSDSLDNLWSHGHCIIGDVTFESAAYVARYVMKKRLGKTAEEYEQEGITPEFVRMSRGSKKLGTGGIGSGWLNKFMSDVYPNGQILANGHMAKPPKYYDQLFERLDPVTMQKIRENRMQAALEKWEESEPRRLRDKERVKKGAINSLTRKEV